MTVTHMQTPVQLETLAEELRVFFTETANELAVETAFVKRNRNLSGASFAQALVFTWMMCSDASYTQLQQMLCWCGCQMSVQGLEQRFSEQAADFLLSLLYEATRVAVAAPELTTELLARLSGVYLQDGSIISLPNELEGLYQGCGGNTETSGKSAMRIQVRLNLKNGEMLGPWIQEARTCERKGAGSFAANPLPENALRVSDSHYFTLTQMREITEAAQGFITGAKADLTLRDKHGVKYDMVQCIKAHEHEKVIDEWVTIGCTMPTQQQVRLLAFRVLRKRNTAGESRSTSRRACAIKAVGGMCRWAGPISLRAKKGVIAIVLAKNASRYRGGLFSSPTCRRRFSPPLKHER
jgi:hypothetical protein